MDEHLPQEQHIRLECIKAAARVVANPVTTVRTVDRILTLAKTFEEFVKTGDIKAEEA